MAVPAARGVGEVSMPWAEMRGKRVAEAARKEVEYCILKIVKGLFGRERS